MSNTYFSWIEDEKLFEAIKYVYEKYQQALQDQDLNSFTNNVIDPFSLLFDTYLTKKTIEQWIKEETDRQAQKTLSNAIGGFHQKILGNSLGWEDLGRNHDTGLDVKKSDDTIFAEIKNKYNTTNSGSSDSVKRKLNKVNELYPNATVYFVEIIRNRTDPYDDAIKFNKDEKVRKISGDKFYELVTNEENALKKLFKKLPDVIEQFISNHQLDYLEPNYRKPSERNRVIRELKSLFNSDLHPLDVYEDFFDRAYSLNKYIKKRNLKMTEIKQAIYKKFDVKDFRELKKKSSFHEHHSKYSEFKSDDMKAENWEKLYQDVFSEPPDVPDVSDEDS
jgi:hypothetical protein